MGAFSPEARENHKEAMNRPEFKEARKVSMQAQALLEMGAFSPEAREKRQAAIKAAYARPEVKENHKAVMKRPEVKEKRQAEIKAAYARPEVKEKQKAAMNRPEVKEKLSNSMKAARARLEVKEKRMETYQEKLAAARTEVFSAEDLDAANRSASQAIGGEQPAEIRAHASSKTGERCDPRCPRSGPA